jgi:lipid-A-disaccharide synthase
MITAGEASGDMYGAALVREIRKLDSSPEVSIEAIGGRQLAGAGVTMLADSTRWGAIGVVAALKVAPKIVAIGMRTQRQMTRGLAGVFVPIDFGFMNVRLAKTAHEAGWKVLYFMPPGSWRRDHQGETLAAVTDEIVTPFSWSASILNNQNATAHFYGHPLKQILAAHEAPPAHDPNRIALLPGSRKHEISSNMPAIARSAKWLGPNFSFEFAIASSASKQRILDLWNRYYEGPKRDLIFTERDTIGVLKRAAAAIICSGTATLEAALCNCPMVVIYKFSRIGEIQARMLRIKPKYISLPNIVLNHPVVPELIQDAAKPKEIARELLEILADDQKRRQQLLAFEDIDEALGDADAITRTASLVLRLGGRV